MSKRKRERMKQKAIRHKSDEGASRIAAEEDEVDSTTGSKSPSKPAASSSKTASTEPAHLAGASPEWKRWYAAVSEAIAASR